MKAVSIVGVSGQLMCKRNGKNFGLIFNYLERLGGFGRLTKNSGHCRTPPFLKRNSGVGWKILQSALRTDRRLGGDDFRVMCVQGYVRVGDKPGTNGDKPP